MSERMQKAVRIAAMLIFVLPYGFSRQINGDTDDVLTVKAVLWEIEIGKKGKIPHFRVRCPVVADHLLRKQ